MVALNPQVNLFSFIGVEHPFYTPLQNLKGQLLSTPLYQKTSRGIGEEVQTRISMKAHPKSNSTWVLKGFSLALQCRDRSDPHRFDAATFVCSNKSGSIESFEFPHDPQLNMTPYFNGQHSKQRPKAGRGVEVLRYYPGKRLAFRTIRADKNATPVIGKFVTRGTVKETYKRLNDVHQAVARSESTFSVAAPLEMNVYHGVFFQEEKPGKAFAHLINERNFCELLHKVGRIHRDLHNLDVPGLPKFEFGTFLRRMVVATEWISFFRPKDKSFLADIRKLLAAHVPRMSAASFTLCHGDFSCLQVLKDDDRYAIIDFDDCLVGDPYVEVARVIAFLKYDVPVFRTLFSNPKANGAQLLQDASGAYLDGYEEGRQTLNRSRLLWYRIYFEIQYLARLFKRDLFQAVAYDRTVETIHELSARFQREREDVF